MIALILTFGSLTGCGPSCYSTCDRLYRPEQCDIRRGGRTAEELVGYCLEECQGAMETPGELEGYNPLEASGSNESVVLENEKQAAVWMDCVQENACDRLSSGFCAPVW